MRAKLTELALRKQALRLSCATQRLALHQACQQSSATWGMLDKLYQAAGWLKRHPRWLTVAGIVCWLLRRRVRAGWLSRGLAAYAWLRRWITPGRH